MTRLLPRDSDGKAAGDETPELDLLEAIPPDIRQAVESLPEDSRLLVAQVFLKHSGPLPAPWIIKRYEEIIPGSAERFLEMLERQENHRIDWENQARADASKFTARGQWMGFSMFLASIVAALTLGMFDKPVVGAAIGVSSLLAALVGRLALRPRRDPEQDAD